MSDYPGVFDKYTQDEFIKVYETMTNDQLGIPHSMRGRDSRIISEEILIPVVFAPEPGESDEDDKKVQRKKGGKKKRRKKREMSGQFYEEDLYEDGQYQYDEQYDDQYGDQYDEMGYGPQAYYYEIPDDNRNAYYYNYQTSQNRLRGPRKSAGGRRQGGGRRGRGGRRGGRGRASRAYYYDDDDDYYNQGGGKKKRGSKSRGYNQEQGRQYRSKRSNQDRQQQKKQNVRWSPRAAKQYNTNKGVYRTKQPSSSSAY